MKFTNNHLTPGEAFHLWVRQSGLSNIQVGEIYGVCQRTVRNWERDRGSAVPNVRSELPDPLPPWTACYILRKRLGMTVRQSARTFGVSFQQFSKWENGDFGYKKLVKYYNNLGWWFE